MQTTRSLPWWLFVCAIVACSGSEPKGRPDEGAAGSAGFGGAAAGSGGGAGAARAGTGGVAGGAGRAGAGRGGAAGAAGARAGAGGVAGGAPAAGSGGSVSTTKPFEPCESPLALADTSKPTKVVGTGTPESCTEAALKAAVAQGGVITFDCGPQPFKLTITQTLIAPGNKDTTLDGADRIELSGGGTTQILRAAGTDFRKSDRVLTVQRLVMSGGRDMGSGFKARDGDKTCAWGYKQGGGGAIYTRDVNIHVIGVTFRDNHGPELGPDVAGGAIYSTGSKKVIVANSTFTGNSAANGGAIGLLHTSAELYNVVFETNKATGMLANFAGATGCPSFNHEEQGGAGGLGGAFYADGQDPGDTFCGVRMSDNTAGDLGGAVFRSAYWGLVADSTKQTFNWDRVTFERNKAAKGGGAGYLNNAAFTLKSGRFDANESKEDGGALKLTGLTLYGMDSEFTGNRAATAGGAIAQWENGPEGAGKNSGMKFSGNKPNDTAGVFAK